MWWNEGKEKEEQARRDGNDAASAGDEPGRAHLACQCDVDQKRRRAIERRMILKRNGSRGWWTYLGNLPLSARGKRATLTASRGKSSLTEEKNLFCCMKAEREQAQPQFYGMSHGMDLRPRYA
jgi:hypothetical protein